MYRANVEVPTERGGGSEGPEGFRGGVNQNWPEGAEDAAVVEYERNSGKTEGGFDDYCGAIVDGIIEGGWWQEDIVGEGIEARGESGGCWEDGGRS